MSMIAPELLGLALFLGFPCFCGDFANLPLPESFWPAVFGAAIMVGLEFCSKGVAICLAKTDVPP
jgi:hypothetical protein